MPTLSVRDGLHFFYTDSGAPNDSSNYKTMIMIHGHTFHSGLFKRLFPLAASHSLRIICPNRREYPGTTPFSPDELKIFNSGTEEERAKLLEQAGIDLALFVDALINECALPKDIIIVAWSLGNIFFISLMASINLLPSRVKDNLTACVKDVVMWHPPCQTLGIPSPPNSYNPLWDENLAPEARGPAFGVWVASYFTHGDLSTRDFAQLNHRHPDKDKKPTTENMGGELFAVTDFTVGDKYETKVVEPPYEGILTRQTEKAIFDPAVREAWGAVSFTHMHGTVDTWNVIYAYWDLEAKAKALGSDRPLLNFKVVQGANHFPMWDQPEAALTNLLACTKPSS